MNTPTENDWRRFSRAFREYHSDMFGNCQCFTCGSVGNWKKFDTGHYIDRRYLTIKFNPLNLEPQCRHCNRALDGNIEVFEKQLKIKYGKWEIKNFLHEKKLNGRQPTREDVQFLIEMYRELRKRKVS